MSNTFVSLPVPVSPGNGLDVDVSALAADKSVVVESGDSNGVIIVEGSHDGVSFSPLVSISIFGDPQSMPVRAVLQRMRVRRLSGYGVVSLNVGAETTVLNLFGSVVVPAFAGAGPMFDSSLMGAFKTFCVSGSYTPVMVVEGSNDGVNFDPLVTLDTGNSISTNFLGVYQGLRVRRLSNGGLPTVTVGAGPLSSGGSGSQGFQGSQGAQGTAGGGPQGFQGNQGNQGNQGTQGEQGNQGSTGTGAQGFQGNQGEQGTQGVGSQGLQGSQGEQGNQGGVGSQGNQGEQGIQGSQGSQGAQGRQGFQGFQGSQGAQGRQGFQGTAGPQTQLQQSFTNGEASTVSIGYIVAIDTTDNTFFLADASIPAGHARKTIGVTKSNIGSGAAGTVVTGGQATVQLQSGLTPVAGQLIYLSTSQPGKGINRVPFFPPDQDAYWIVIGTIESTANYGTDQTVVANIEIDVQLSLPSTKINLFVVGGPSTVAIGTVVRQSNLGNQQFEVAQATSIVNSTGVIGAVAESRTASFDFDIVVSGRAVVLLAPALTPVTGDLLWLSTTSGTATNVEPTDPGAIKVPLGTILDTSTYGTNSLVLADLQVEPQIQLVGVPFTLLKFSGVHIGDAGAASYSLADTGAYALSNALTTQPYPLPDCVLHNLRVQVVANPLATDMIVEVYKNGVATGVLVTVTAAATGLFTNLVNTVTFTANDLLDLRTDSTGAGVAVAQLLATIEAYSP